VTENHEAPTLPDIVAGLESRRAEILAAYEHALREKCGPLASDPASLQQVLQHAELILADVVESLRHNRVVANERNWMLAQEIGARRARFGVHPTESLKAASELFDIVMPAVAKSMRACDDSALLLGALALHDSLMMRIREAAASYTGFLIDMIHRAHLEERERLARELHDRLGAHISIAQRQLELHEMSSADPPPAADKRIAAALQALAGAAKDIPELISGLRVAEPLGGLEQALCNYLRAGAAGDFETIVTVNGDESWVPPGMQDEVFLVIREALRNSLTHGQPRRIRVRVNIAPHELRAAIDDDGIGFDPSAARGSGSGVRSMQERVAQMGGNFTLLTSPGAGAHVQLVVPIERGRPDAQSG
jgi:signal transduction histidine kinase